MNKEFLDKYNLTESQKRFKQILEYTFITKDINEDGEDDEQAQNPGGGDDPMDMPDVNQQLPTPNQMGNDGGGDASDMGGAQGGGQSPDGNMPDMGAGNDDSSSESELGDTLDLDDGGNDEEEVDIEGGDDEDEVDVTDLTNAQKETKDDVNNLSSNFEELIDMISSLNDKLSQNDAKIEDLKSEFEKRNPTEVERLNLRSQDSMPFNVKPKDYWEEKSKDSNYKVEFDNSVSTSDEPMEYVITRGEIENIGNEKEIADSFDVDDLDGDEYNQDLAKIFKL